MKRHRQKRNCYIKKKSLHLCMPYDLTQIKHFAAIAEAGSLGRAAMELHLTQPALSRSIRRLEGSVGAPLFERHTKGMMLTDIGRALLPHAQQMQHDARVAREEIDAMRGLAKGTIRIGAIASISSSVLPDLLSSVLARWPGLHVQVVEDVWNNLAQILIKGDVDLVLSVEVPDTEEIVSIKNCQWKDSSGVVAAAAHPLRQRSKISVADIHQEPWAFLPKGTEPYGHLQRLFAAQGMGMPNIVVETRSVLVLKSLVTNAGFLSWMPEPMYRPERKADDIHALPVSQLTNTRTLTAFRRRTGVLPGSCVKLLEELRRHGREVALNQ
jgi:DNA-binding transcriptional LysR family regulator